jgi:hypothetical protein
MRFLLPISVLTCLVMCSCGKPSGQPKVKKESLAAIPNKDSSIRTFPAPALGSAEMEVWNSELALFQAKDIHTYMSLWDDGFVGWPDNVNIQCESPILKRALRTSSNRRNRRLLCYYLYLWQLRYSGMLP